jgi:hypothetical protein
MIWPLADATGTAQRVRITIREVVETILPNKVREFRTPWIRRAQ